MLAVTDLSTTEAVSTGFEFVRDRTALNTMPRRDSGVSVVSQ